MSINWKIYERSVPTPGRKRKHTVLVYKAWVWIKTPINWKTWGAYHIRSWTQKQKEQYRWWNPSLLSLSSYVSFCCCLRSWHSFPFQLFSVHCHALVWSSNPLLYLPLFVIIFRFVSLHALSYVRFPHPWTCWTLLHRFLFRAFLSFLFFSSNCFPGLCPQVWFGLLINPMSF